MLTWPSRVGAWRTWTLKMVFNVALTLHIRLKIIGHRLQVISSHLKGSAHRYAGRMSRVRVENPSICVCREQIAVWSELLLSS